MDVHVPRRFEHRQPLAKRAPAKKRKPHGGTFAFPQIFQSPQLIIKQSWLEGSGRFQAALVHAAPGAAGVLCSDSYVSVHAPAEQREILEAAWLAQNSKWATYYQLLTSGQFAACIPKPLEGELRSLPLPEPRRGLLDGIKTVADVDNRIRELLSFKESEWALIEDLFAFTLPDFKAMPTRLAAGPRCENLKQMRLPNRTWSNTRSSSSGF